METMGKKMLSIYLIIFFIVIIIGVFGNGFIAAFYCSDWVKRRKISSCDMILTSLSTSRILLLGVSVANILISVITPGILHMDEVWITSAFLWYFAHIFCLWLTACLSIFYCVKITNINQPLFRRMKQRISAMVPKLLLLSLLISSISSLPCIWGKYNIFHCVSTKDLFRNSTVAVTNWDVSYLYFILLYAAASFIPFIIFSLSSILLIASLWRHTRNMQPNATNVWNPNTVAHVRAIKTLISCLILYIFSFISVCVQTLPTCVTDNTWTPAITSIITCAYPSGHSIILILINPQLKHAIVRTLREGIF